MENLISKVMGSNPNPYLEGNFRPVKEVLTATKLDVIGSVPRDLFGTYLRNGPNPKLKTNRDNSNSKSLFIIRGFDIIKYSTKITK